MTSKARKNARRVARRFYCPFEGKRLPSILCSPDPFQKSTEELLLTLILLLTTGIGTLLVDEDDIKRASELSLLNKIELDIDSISESLILILFYLSYTSAEKMTFV